MMKLVPKLAPNKREDVPVPFLSPDGATVWCGRFVWERVFRSLYAPWHRHVAEREDVSLLAPAHSWDDGTPSWRTGSGARSRATRSLGFTPCKAHSVMAAGLMLATYSTAETGADVYPSQDRLATGLALRDRQAVAPSLFALERLGWIASTGPAYTSGVKVKSFRLCVPVAMLVWSGNTPALEEPLPAEVDQLVGVVAGTA